MKKNIQLILLMGFLSLGFAKENKVLDPEYEHSSKYYSPIERYRYNWGISALTGASDHFIRLHMAQSIAGRHLLMLKEVLESRVQINQADQRSDWQWNFGILLNGQLHFKYLSIYAEGGPLFSSHHWGFKNGEFMYEVGGGLQLVIDDNTLFQVGYKNRDVRSGSRHFANFGFSVGY